MQEVRLEEFKGRSKHSVIPPVHWGRRRVQYFIHIRVLPRSIFELVFFRSLLKYPPRRPSAVPLVLGDKEIV